MLWCQGAQNIELSKRKLNIRAIVQYDHNAHPSLTDRPIGRTDKQTDRQTDRWTDGRKS